LVAYLIKEYVQNGLEPGALLFFSRIVHKPTVP